MKYGYLCTIRVLPDFHQDDAGVEAVENEQGQTDARDDSPRQEPVEPAQKVIKFEWWPKGIGPGNVAD